MKTNILPDRWKEVELGDVLDYEQPTNYIVDSDDYNEDYNTPVLTAGKSFILGYTDETEGIYDKLPVIIFDDFTTASKFVTFPFKVKSSAMKLLTPKTKDVDLKFIFWLMQTLKINSITHKRYYLSKYQHIKIALPPLDTQQKIVSILERAEKAKEWRKDADALTNEFLKSVFVEMFGDPMRNPKKWELVKFGDVGELARGKSKHRPRNDPKLLGGKYPLVQTGEVANSGGYISNYTQTYSEIGLKQSKMWSKGTLCITIAANIAMTGILTFDSCFPDSIVGFNPNDKVKTEYIQYWLSFLQKTLEDNAPESAQKNINLQILTNLKIPCPPIELQQKFAANVKQVEALKEHQKQSKEQIDNLFNALMQKAFKGELIQ